MESGENIGAATDLVSVMLSTKTTPHKHNKKKKKKKKPRMVLTFH
jgi:hypothetical protein